MAKTRSQTGDLTIKKEEEEDPKDAQLLHSVKNTTGNSSKITKRKPSKNKNRRPLDQDIKVEEGTDTKSLLQSAPKSSVLVKRRRITQEQINQLIDYIVNDKIGVTKAARKVNMNRDTGRYYCNIYKNDPEKKIPVPRSQRIHHIYYTQEQIEALIKYINDDKMSVSRASAKVNMPYASGKYHYAKYLKNPNHNTRIPLLRHYYTQEQKNEFIGYIVNDKMNIKEASKKARMNSITASKYYREYFNDQNPDITTPSHISSSKYHTQEQTKKVISYIVNNKMTVSAAARKANMYRATATIHYRRYLKDNNMDLPVPKNNKPYTPDKVNEFIGYIVDDKMSTYAASKKANMNYETGKRHYRQYRKDHNIEGPTRRYTQDQKNEVIGYIVNDKMSITTASKKANMSWATGNKYYLEYLNDQKHGSHTHRLRVDSVIKNK